MPANTTSEASPARDPVASVAVRIGGPALATLAAALVMDRPELGSAAPPIEILAAVYRGDSAASATVRRHLEELGLHYEFTMRRRADKGGWRASQSRHQI
jgi:hypothetical protein